MSLMQPQDAAFLLAEAREKPMHVAGLQLFEPPDDAGPDFVSGLYEEAITPGEVNPALARRPGRMLGGLGPWRWEYEPDPDLEYHVRHSALPHPGRVRELLALVGRLHGLLLARSRPLWEAHLIEGLNDGRFALYAKVHHALVDGVSAMRLLERTLTTDPDRTDVPPLWAARPGDEDDPGSDGHGTSASSIASLPGTLVAGARMGLRAVTGAAQSGARSLTRSVVDAAEMLPYRAPRSALNVPITGARRVAADRWPLERLRAVAKASDSTLNDVLLGMCGGALRAYLDGLGELPDSALVAMVPVSLRADDDRGGGNAVGLLLCSLGTDVADPGDRFEVIRESMRRGKLRLEGLTPEAIMLLSAAAMVPLGLGPLFRFESLRRPPFNVVISNVPGPRHTLYLNRAKMVGHYPVSIPYDGLALNITATSYDGALGIGLIGCRQSLPHLQRMLGYLDTSLAELEKVTGAA